MDKVQVAQYVRTHFQVRTSREVARFRRTFHRSPRDDRKRYGPVKIMAEDLSIPLYLINNVQVFIKTSGGGE